jgi:RNA recognition motif-containing protein
MITPAGKPQGFGFVEYPDPVSASRAVRLLNGLELPTFEDGTVIKTLLVKPDEKTRMFLDTESGGGVDDEQAQKEIEVLMEEIREQSKKFAEGGHLDKEKYVIPPHLHDLQEKDLPDAQVSFTFIFHLRKLISL